MPHHTPLISTIVVGLVLAFIFGAIANRLRVSPLVGYLVAGVAVGPFTPGFVADQGLADQLAEIGVILLMFGVGLHFSLKDLLSVRAIAVPGAIAQIGIATLMGMGVAWTLGWSTGAGIVFGLSLSVASTVVLLRALQERRLVETERGRIAVGWLIVEDIAMVLTLVLLPALADLLKGKAATPADLQALALPVAITLGKVAAFVALMLVVGRRVIPWILHYVAHTGSRELFRLSVLAIAFGVAFGATELFGVSFALGAFFAGMVLSESELSHRAAQESLPLRDAFAVLFFVSVGMLFDPTIILREPLPILATLFVIVIGKSIVAFGLMRAFGHDNGSALTISASLAQIGEFSFILAGLGVGLEILPAAGRDLVLAGAILSILINPFLFVGLDRMRKKAESDDAPSVAPVLQPLPVTSLSDHVVLIGHGRVGSFITPALAGSGIPCLVIEADDERAERIKGGGVESIAGNAADADVLAAANVAAARCLLVAIPDAFEGGQAVANARAINPTLPIIARAHSDEEVDHLRKYGASDVVMGEREIATAMIARVPQAAGFSPAAEAGHPVV